MKTKVLSLIYFLTGALFIVIGDQKSFLPGFVLKSLIIPVLIVIFIVNTRPLTGRLHRLMLAGLLFSWAGDVILEVPHEYADLFIPGLACFLLAHVMYLSAFFLTPGKNTILSSRKYFLFPVLIYGIALISFLYSDLSAMRLPVILYAIVILTMLSGAINRYKKVNRLSYLLVFTGALLFVISDSAIAVNKFGHNFGSSGLVIMSTYVIAQFFIILGYIKQFREKLA